MIRNYMYDIGGGAHADYAPSSAKAWGKCTALVPMLKTLRAEGLVLDVENAATRKGSIMHAHAEWILKENKDPSDCLGTLRDNEAGDGRTYVPDTEWAPLVFPYVEFVQTLIREAQEWGEYVDFGFEPRVPIYGAHCWGSVDAWVLVGTKLYVIDLKTGGGLVPAEENPQLALYAYGVLELIWEKSETPEGRMRRIDTVELVVAQAKHPEGPLLRWETTTDWVLKHRGEHAVKIVESRDEKRRQFVAGDHCTYCPVKRLGRCPAQREALLSVLDTVGDEPFETAVQERPVLSFDALSAEAVGALLEKASVIRDLLAAAEQEATVRHLRGTDDAPKGWKVVEGRSVRRYRRALGEGDIVEELNKLGVNPYVRKLIPMGEAEKWAGKGNIDHLLEKPPGGPKLVPADAKGVPYSPEVAIKVLDNI